MEVMTETGDRNWRILQFFKKWWKSGLYLSFWSHLPLRSHFLHSSHTGLLLVSYTGTPATIGPLFMFSLLQCFFFPFTQLAPINSSDLSLYILKIATCNPSKKNVLFKSFLTLKHQPSLIYHWSEHRIRLEL